jgi:hypothetical protein
MKTFTLPESTAQKVIDYLVKRPYDEVYALIAALMQLQTIEPHPPIPYKNENKTEG